MPILLHRKQATQRAASARCVVLLAALLFMASRAAALPMISLGTDAPLVMDAGTSGDMLVDIFSDVVTSDPAEHLSGWQVTLVVRPDPGAAGTVSFTAATEPSADYVLESLPVTLGVTTIPAPIPSLATTLTIIDGELAFPVSGVAVPDGSGANLLDLMLSASINARGSFGLFLDQNVPLSVWTDAGTTSNQFFANAIDVDGLARIGDIQVIAAPGVPGVVPEPLSALTVLWSLAALGAWLRRRRIPDGGVGIPVDDRA
ncbi:MAG: hypothetical protein CMJ18_19930 [Phycisphaeraceae bacterium]|nr:hypothetical protein [Phycisphaeraceae bacterium]